MVSPKGKLVGASLVTVSTAQLSSVAGVPKAIPVALQFPELASSVISAGAVIVGSVLSKIVTF